MVDSQPAVKILDEVVVPVGDDGARVVAASSLWRRGWPALLIAALAGVLLAGGALDWLKIEVLQREYAQLLAWASARPIVTGVSMAVALTMLVASGLPGAILFLLAGGALFGTVPGALIGLFGSTVGGSVLYATSRRLFLGHAKPPPAWVERFREGFDRSPVTFALFLRLAPVFPFGAASIALAWLGCRPVMFVLTSALGIVPSLLVYSSLGAGLSMLLASGAPIDSDALSQPAVWLPLTALGVLGLFAAAFGYLRGRKPR